MPAMRPSLETVPFRHLSGRHTDCCLALFCVYKRMNVLGSLSWCCSFFSPQECFYLLIFDCSGSLLLQAGFSPVGASKGRSLVAGRFPCFRAWTVGLPASVDVTHDLSNCGSRAQAQYCGTQAPLLGDTWHLPGSGIEPMSPAWQEDSSPLSNQGSLLTSPPPSRRVFSSLAWSQWVLLHFKLRELDFYKAEVKSTNLGYRSGNSLPVL